MRAHVAETWVSPERGCRLPPLTDEQMRLVDHSCTLSAKNHVIHVEVMSVDRPPYRRNALWEALRAVGSTTKTASYGSQSSWSMRLHDPPIECTVMVSHAPSGTPDVVYTADETVSTICVLGVKDFATACIVGRAFVTKTVYYLTGCRFIVRSIKPCNTLFVGKIADARINLSAMATRLTPVYCTRHDGIDMVTMTAQIVVNGVERTATCNIWASGSLNILGMPDYDSNAVAMAAFVPTIVRFAAIATDAAYEPAPARVIRKSEIDQQMSWGRVEASRWLMPAVTQIRVHPLAQPGLVLARERIQPGLPVPRASWFVAQAEQRREERDANEFTN